MNLMELPSRPRLLLIAMLAAVIMSSGKVARGETLEDTGFWLMLMMEGSIGDQEQKPGRLRWWLDIQPRFLGNISGLQQGLLRPGVGYVLGQRTTAWLGYARVHTTSPAGASSNEDRIWQQLLWKPRVGDFAFQSRTRLEQRFLDTGPGTGWRFRQFVKVGWDLPGTSRFSLVGYDEVFVNLNDTDWGQRTGFAQNRLFAGLAAKLGEAKAEIGYLNQLIDRPGPNQMNHILSFNLFLNF
ncbi:MAG: DUF2490 domain-containing protein [Gammaproteobacteria bacterium]|nr:DUF2490 domain-containing protein [Gammaproteobacteria bacterium]